MLCSPRGTLAKLTECISSDLFHLTIVSYGNSGSQVPLPQAGSHNARPRGTTAGLCRHRLIESVTKPISLGKQNLARSVFKQMLLVSPEPLEQIRRPKVKLGSSCEL